MTTHEARTGNSPDGRPNVGNRRRAQSKDTLMPDEPPRFLGVAIPVIAGLLVFVLMAFRLVEYQDAVRVSLTLKTEESLGRVYGEAYLQQGEASAVRAEQVVDIDLGGYRGAKSRWLQAKVGEIKAADVRSFYWVRVDLPTDFDVSSLPSTPPDSIQVEAKILTQKNNLFDKLFGAFRVLSRNL